MESLQEDFEYPGFPRFISYLFKVINSILLYSCFNPIWYNTIAGLAIPIYMIYSYFTSGFESSGNSCESYRHETRTKEKPTIESSTFEQVEKTYKFENVRQLSNQVTATRRLYENGRN